MKKMFLLMLLCPVVLPAQIAISEFKAAPGTVTFTVNWNKPSVDSAWVFVDYNNAGTMTRLPLSDVSASAGSAYMVLGNNQGAWVVADAPVFSATVQLVATCRDARPCVPTGACVYAIDYPPVGIYTNASAITFKGTPPFYLEFTDGSTPATVSEKTGDSYTGNFADKTIASFHDATGAPGVITPATFTLEPSAAGYCEGSSGVLFSLSGTNRGVQYQLIKDNKYATPVANLTGTGSAATFSGTFPAGVYVAKSVKNNLFRDVAMADAHTVSVNAPGTDGQSSSPCGCTTGTTECSGTCTPTGNHTKNDGPCTGACNTAYVRQFNQCGSVVNSTYSTYTNTSCTDGCSSSAFTVSSTGGLSTTYAASTKSWTIGSATATQTWSDRIVRSVCTNSSSFATSNYTTREQNTSNGYTYYSWACVTNNLQSLCPSTSGWRVPSSADVALLKLHLDEAVPDPLTELLNVWGTDGYYLSDELRELTNMGIFWTQSMLGEKPAVAWYTKPDGYFPGYASQPLGITVRCVK